MKKPIKKSAIKKSNSAPMSIITEAKLEVFVDKNEVLTSGKKAISEIGKDIMEMEKSFNKFSNKYGVSVIGVSLYRIQNKYWRIGITMQPGLSNG